MSKIDEIIEKYYPEVEREYFSIGNDVIKEIIKEVLEEIKNIISLTWFDEGDRLLQQAIKDKIFLQIKELFEEDK
jgi:hypothetical protein